MLQIKPIPTALADSPWWDGEVVWLSGATGSWGQELCRQLLTLPIGKLLCFCRGEHRAYDLNKSLNDARVRIHLGDIRDEKRIRESMVEATTVIHAAALKRIDSVSYNPNEIIDVNVRGTQTIIENILNGHTRVLRAFYISSDKAAEPTTLYGATKFLAEQSWLAANVYTPDETDPHFSAARFGNAIGSNGSVLRIWQEQIEKGEPLTITDPLMTRFLITLPQAVRFLLSQIVEMKGGELYAPEMPSCSVITLRNAFAPTYPYRLIGNRGYGEKQDETLGEGRDSFVDEIHDARKIRQLLEEGGIKCPS